MKITPKSFLDNLSIAKKSAILIIAVTLGTLLIGATAHYGIKDVKNSYEDMYKRYYKPIQILKETRDLIQEKSTIQSGVSKWQSYLKNYYTNQNALKSDLQNIINETQTLWEKLKRDYNPNTKKSLDGQLSKLSSYYLAKVKDSHRQSSNKFDKTQYLVIALTSLVTLISLFLSMLIAKNFNKILANLASIVEKTEEENQKREEEIEQKIIDAVKEARQKDQIIYQNARLASMGEMIANIAHQWRQPLNALTLLIQSFGTKSMTGNLTKEFIDTQVNEGLRLAVSMSDTIEDFRNFFSINRQKEYFDLKESINNTLDMSSFFLKDENIDIKIQANDGIKIYGYTNEFSQVLLNLINNARENFKYNNITEDKKILINLKKEDDLIILEFIDNGGGIKENIIDRIFEPYFTTKHKSIGTGIGLYMSKQIIETQMNGKLEVENITCHFADKEFKCAKFTIYFTEA